jgi:hypothetical protein
MVQHSEYTFACAGWVGAANVRPNLLLVRATLSFCLRSAHGLELAKWLATVSLLSERLDNVLEHCPQDRLRALTTVPYNWECLSVQHDSQLPVGNCHESFDARL